MATATQRTTTQKTKAKPTPSKKAGNSHYVFDEKIAAALDMGKKGFEQGKKQALEQAEILLDKLEKEVKAKPHQSILIAFLVGIIIGRVLLK